MNVVVNDFYSMNVIVTSYSAVSAVVCHKFFVQLVCRIFCLIIMLFFCYITEGHPLCFIHSLSHSFHI